MNRNVMLIDDEECIRKAATRLLQRDDITVTTLPDGQNAAEAVAAKRPAVVFLDFKMPGKDGLEVLKEIKAASPDTPVFMVSGYMNSESAAQAGRLGASDYILKPVDWHQLRDLARQYVERGSLAPKPEDYAAH